MELNFTKNGSIYEAKATLTGDSVLSVERVNAGSFTLWQSHKDNGNYTPVQLSPTEHAILANQYIDTVLHDDSYPVYIKFVSTEEVIVAELMEV